MRYVSAVSPRGNRSWSEKSQAQADARCRALDDAGCIDCIDCVDCTNCYRCHYCTGCAGCVGCISCAGCTDCVDCLHCTDCTDCTECLWFVGRSHVHGMPGYKDLVV